MLSPITLSNLLIAEAQNQGRLSNNGQDSDPYFYCSIISDYIRDNTSFLFTYTGTSPAGIPEAGVVTGCFASVLLSNNVHLNLTTYILELVNQSKNRQASIDTVKWMQSILDDMSNSPIVVDPAQSPTYQFASPVTCNFQVAPFVPLSDSATVSYTQQWLDISNQITSNILSLSVSVLSPPSIPTSNLATGGVGVSVLTPIL